MTLTRCWTGMNETTYILNDLGRKLTDANTSDSDLQEPQNPLESFAGREGVLHVCSLLFWGVVFKVKKFYLRNDLKLDEIKT